MIFIIQNKKIYLSVLLFLVCILSISSISATESTINEEVTCTYTDQENNLETDIRYEDVLTSNKNDELNLEENNNQGKFETDKTTIVNTDTLTFADLNRTINDNTNSTIYLSNNYIYNNDTDSNFKNGIAISRNLIVYGNGVTLDGNNMARIFNVDNLDLNVKFYNIVFINGLSDFGGAICNGNAYNCTFTNNTGYNGGVNTSGGGIYNGNAYNCTFIHNNAGYYGGAICNGNAYNCTFTNDNTAQLGGSIYKGTAYNCIFLNNSAYEGGAISEGNAYNCTFTEQLAKHGGAICNGNAYNCTFTNNTGFDGGAIRYGNAYNCTFTNNNASDGGAICNGNAYNCTFTNNTGYTGGALNIGNAYNCTFTNNTARNDGGALNIGNAYNCTFTNNTAGNYGGALNIGNAYNCTFTNNTAGNYGGALNSSNATNCIFNNNNATIGQAMYQGNAILCIFNGNTNNDTNIIPSTINVLNYTSTYQSGERLKFNLTADNIEFDGFNTTIKIYKDNVLYTTVYGLTGEGWIVDLNPNTYTAVLSLTSYPDEKPSNVTIIVLKRASKIISSPVITTYNIGKNLVITLKDGNGKPISGTVLTVKLGSSKKYTTNANGQVKINVGTLTPKTYTAKITYAGSDFYNGTTGSAKVTVKKAKPKITAKSTSFKLKLKTKKYTVTFKNNKYQALKNTKVTLKVNGKTYSVKTNSKGQGVFKITNLKKKGSYTAVITVPTNKYYNKVSKKVKITVKQ